MADHSLRILLTRDQRRALDRAAKASGLKTSPWARSTLLDAVRQRPEGQDALRGKLGGAAAPGKG